MAKTRVSFTASEKLLKGVDIMADAVASTLGPRGKNVAIAKTNYRGEIYERITLKDGVSVARAIDLSDEEENMGAQLLKEAAQKQVDGVGDGTTVTMILAQAILHEFMTMTAAGVDPTGLSADVKAVSETLISAIADLAIPIKTASQLEHIATISARSEELGKLVATAVTRQGSDGTIVVEPSQNTDTSVEYQKGMQLDKGFMDPYFVTNPDTMEAVLENAYVLVTDKPIYSLLELEKVLNAVAADSKKIVIIASEFGLDALTQFVKNKMTGALLPLCIQAPSFAHQQTDLLSDIALVTGATFVSNISGKSFEELTLEDLGTAQNVTSTKTKTIIVGATGHAKAIQRRITSLKTQLKQESSDFEQKKLEERLAKLTNGVCVIRVGGVTEIEMKERRERVIDAVAATKAAKQSGIVPGGEIVYLYIREQLNDDQFAQRLLYNALGKPFLKLMANAGYDGGQMLERLKGSTITKTEGLGIDATDGLTKNLLSEGIVDPVAVPMHAIENAVSVAIQLAETGVLITPEREPNATSNRQ